MAHDPLPRLHSRAARPGQRRREAGNDPTCPPGPPFPKHVQDPVQPGRNAQGRRTREGPRAPRAAAGPPHCRGLPRPGRGSRRFTLLAAPLGHLPSLTSPAFTLKEEFKRLQFSHSFLPHASVRQPSTPLRIRGPQAAQWRSGEPRAGVLCRTKTSVSAVPHATTWHGLRVEACLAERWGRGHRPHARVQSQGPAWRRTAATAALTGPCQAA